MKLHSSGLLAYQFETEQRAQDLFDWMQEKLEKGHDFEKMQAAWVALREVIHLDVANIEERLTYSTCFGGIKIFVFIKSFETRDE